MEASAVDNLWGKVRSLGAKQPYRGPFIWHHGSFSPKEVSLTLDELGYSYVTLCIQYVRLHEAATSLGVKISEGRSTFEDNVRALSCCWEIIYTADRILKFLNSKDGIVRFAPYDQLPFRLPPEISALAKRYRDIDSHRPEQFKNHVERKKHGPLHGVLCFVDIRPNEHLNLAESTTLRASVVYCDADRGDGNMIANLDGFPKQGSRLQVGASCLCLIVDNHKFHLSEDILMIIETLSAEFYALEKKILNALEGAYPSPASQSHFAVPMIISYSGSVSDDHNIEAFTHPSSAPR